MNKFLTKVYDFFGCNLTKNNKANNIKIKVVKGKQKALQDLKKTNGIIKVMIESGELNLKLIKK